MAKLQAKWRELATSQMKFFTNFMSMLQAKWSELPAS